MAVLRPRGKRLEMVELDACRLRLTAGNWDYASRHADAIAENWRTACAANDKLFNGDVFIVVEWRLAAGNLEASVVQTKFAAYLHWRETGFRDGGYDEAFATTAVLASDGGMLVARAVDGTLNEGHYVSPGGLIDRRDVGADGLLDPAGAAVRELAEETGLSLSIATRRPGYLLARDAPYLAIASIFDVAATSDELLARVEEFITGRDEPELLEPMIIRRGRELDRLPLTTPARLIGAHLLD